MTRNPEPHSAKFSACHGLTRTGRACWVGVIVSVSNVTGAHPIPTGGLVHKAGRIKILYQRDQIGSVRLANAIAAARFTLALVENIPHNDGGTIPMIRDHCTDRKSTRLNSS